MIARAVSQSRKVNSLSLQAALLWTWAIPWFDGYGYLEAEADYLKLNILPRRNDITEEMIPKLVEELSTTKLWKLFENKQDGKLIAFDPKFNDFQNIRQDREGKQKFTPGELLDYSRTTPAEDKINEVKIREDKIIKAGKTKSPFSLSKNQKEELAELCDKVSLKFPDKFNPWQWLKRNIDKHPLTHLHVMKQMLSEDRILDPWPYANKIALVEDGNYNERESQTKSSRYKADFLGIAENLKKMEEKKI